MSEILQLLRSHDIEQTYHQLTTGREYIAADRYTGALTRLRSWTYSSASRPTLAWTRSSA